MSVALTLMIMLVFMTVGMLIAAILDTFFYRWLAGRTGGSLLTPLYAAAAEVSRQRISTEAPDRMNWFLSISAFLTLGAIGLAVVPLGPQAAVIGIETSVVLWGACESLVVVLVFLHGWSP
ncbi:hypothetical protein LCGC14_2935050, partial [marine sediment metagenome]